MTTPFKTDSLFVLGQRVTLAYSVVPAPPPPTSGGKRNNNAYPGVRLELAIETGEGSTIDAEMCSTHVVMGETLHYTWGQWESVGGIGRRFKHAVFRLEGFNTTFEAAKACASGCVEALREIERARLDMLAEREHVIANWGGPANAAPIETASWTFAGTQDEIDLPEILAKAEKAGLKEVVITIEGFKNPLHFFKLDEDYRLLCNQLEDTYLPKSVDYGYTSTWWIKWSTPRKVASDPTRYDPKQGDARWELTSGRVTLAEMRAQAARKIAVQVTGSK